MLSLPAIVSRCPGLWATAQRCCVPALTSRLSVLAAEALILPLRGCHSNRLWRNNRTPCRFLVPSLCIWTSLERIVSHTDLMEMLLPVKKGVLRSWGNEYPCGFHLFLPTPLIISLSLKKHIVHKRTEIYSSKWKCIKYILLYKIVAVGVLDFVCLCVRVCVHACMLSMCVHIPVHMLVETRGCR